MKCELFGVFIMILVSEMVTGNDIALLSEASSEFSQTLYREIAINKENVVYSPFSIHLALTLTWSGACGTTAEQIANTLKLPPIAGSQLHLAYRDLIVQLNSVSNVELYTSNALFLNPRIDIKHDFVREAEENYFSLVSNINLDAPGGPERPINDFVNAKTHGIIQDFLPPDSINEQTSLVLINTLFFNGTWRSPFNEHNTIKQPFYKTNGVTFEVAMMKDVKYVYFLSDDHHRFDIVGLPFENTRFGLSIVLPRDVDGISRLENLFLSPNYAKDVFGNLKLHHVDLSIPKFKIETDLSLKEPLQRLGMVDAFEEFAGDFTGISTSNGIYISKVLHKAVIEVQETGTVAAAATAVIGVLSLSAIMPIKPTFTFIADHPFLFFLCDKETKQILFQGKFSG